jgi:hypothetical protein
LRPLESVTVFGLSVAFRENNNTVMLLFWYLALDIQSVLFHVEFEAGLSISVLKTRGNSTQKLHLEITGS